MGIPLPSSTQWDKTEAADRGSEMSKIGLPIRSNFCRIPHIIGKFCYKIGGNKLSLNRKIMIIIGVPVISLFILIAFGQWALENLTQDLRHIVNDQFVVLIEKQITPLISNEMLPLINDDIVRLQNLQNSIKLMIEADRDLTQAVIAEKMSLVASEPPEIEAAKKASSENINQAAEKMKKASASFETEEIQKIFSNYLKAIDLWTQKTQYVAKLANTPGKSRFARKASESGSAFKAFAAVRVISEKLQDLQEKRIQDAIVEVNAKKTRINAEEGKIEDKKEEVFKISDSVYQHASYMKTLFNAVGLFAAFIAITLALLLARSINRSINDVVAGLKDAAQGEGDLTKRLRVKSKDEIGSLAKWFNTFVQKLHGIITDIAGNSEKLHISSSELFVISKKMSDGADKMSVKSGTVAAAAEEMSSNLSSVAAAAEQSSTNISMVSSAAEEMKSTINEIAQNTEKTRISSNLAVDRTKKASENIDQLSKSAQKIGKVVETINEISEQTNLLALNATIEAARSGEAGKGFAVVAGEIKTLARQTAEATMEIKQKIETIQDSTSQTVSEIEEISLAIKTVNEMIDTVAASVEEQSVTTKEIASNVIQATQGIQEVTENVTQSSTVANEIAKDIAEVNQAATEMSANSTQVNARAGGLSQLSEQLKKTIDQFKI